jgi:hypothetical protein
MAVGTVTQQAIDPHSPVPIPVSIGDLKMTVTNVVGSASYTAGGDSLTPAQLGLSTVLASQAELQVSAVTAPVATAATYLPSTQLFKVWQASGAEMTAATNLGTITFQVIAFGY